MPNDQIKPPQVKPSSLPFMPVRIRTANSNSRPYCDLRHDAPKHAYRRDRTQMKIASYKIDIIGYPTFLCPTCAKQWRADMATALLDIARTSPNLHLTDSD